MADHREEQPGRRRLKTVMIGLGVGLGATVISGVAFAAWTISADGSASDKAGSVQQLKIIAEPDPTADLFPSKTGAAQFTVQNPNPFTIKLATITFGTVTSSNETSCPASNLTVPKTAVQADITVGAKTTSPKQSLADVFTLSANAPDGCQGVTFTVTATGTGTQQ